MQNMRALWLVLKKFRPEGKYYKCRFIENDLSLALNIDYKFKSDLNSSTCVPNIKAVLLNVTEL
jgi:hypothetical protein